VISIACLAPAYGADAIGLSGYELFPGNQSGDVVRGVLFAGGTHASCGCFTTDVSGTWVASVDRYAGGGIGGQPVLIVGGKLTLETDEVARTFRIQGGTVAWPRSLQESMNTTCGPGVATFVATLAGRRTLTGCLDDTHLDPYQQPFVFPPRIWGTLQ
jgi:hypothetical protein